jgi:hypothetical protein
MPRTQRFPRLEIEVTPDRWQTAVTATSGSCLIADTLKDQYPQFSGVIVDAQTIRMTDKAAGQRYTYLTPNSAQELLLHFDQGWSEPEEHTVRLRVPVKVETVTKARTAKAQREVRKTELQAKRDAGEKLTRGESTALGRMVNEDARGYPERPHARGPIAEVIGRREGNATVIGGSPLRRPRPEKHPNLLGGHNRLFGAKSARPAKVFAEAVEDAVQRRLAEMKDESQP